MQSVGVLRYLTIQLTNIYRCDDSFSSKYFVTLNDIRLFEIHHKYLFSLSKKDKLRNNMTYEDQ